MKHLFRKPAFTLAEVLITLTIIGVIAAIVIPNLIQRHFEQEMISKLKKNYNVLSNALALAIRENGTVDEWDITAKDLENSEKAYNYLKPYLKVQKECGHASGCLADTYESLFGNANVKNLRGLGSTYTYNFMLEDGTVAGIAIYNADCKDNERCMNLALDLNNKKGPNRLGMDTFFFIITPKAVRPYGMAQYLESNNGNDTCEYDGTSESNGISCAAHVLYKGNMDYLRKSITDDWESPNSNYYR